MNEVFTKILQIDLSQVPASVIEGLQKGTMTLSEKNGVVYWASGSGKTGVVTHLPLKEVVGNPQLLLEGALHGQMVAAGVATAVVVVAIAVATVYLAAKIDGVAATVNGVSRVVHQQDQREFAREVAQYFGEINAGQEVLDSRSPPAEVASVAARRVDPLASLRHQAYHYVRSLQEILRESAKSGREEYDRGVRFMVAVLDLIPAAMVVERNLHLAAGHATMAQDLRTKAAAEYRREVKRLQEWMDDQRYRLAVGLDGHADSVAAQSEAVGIMANSPVNEMLLGGLDAHFASQPIQPGSRTSEGADLLNQLVQRYESQPNSAAASNGAAFNV